MKLIFYVLEHSFIFTVLERVRYPITIINILALNISNGNIYISSYL